MMASSWMGLLLFSACTVGVAVGVSKTYSKSVDWAGKATTMRRELLHEEALEDDIEDEVSTACYIKKTTDSELGDGGKGSVHFMDRHNMKCEEGEAMRTWRMISGGMGFFMQYECCPVLGGATSLSASHNTPPNEEINKLSALINFPAVDCNKENGFIRQWAVRRRDPPEEKNRFGRDQSRRRNIVIQYKCASPADGYTLECDSITGEGQEDGPNGGSLVYLDRQNPECPSDTLMSKWDIERIDDVGQTGHMRTNIKCCSVVPPPTPSPTPDPTPAPTAAPTAAYSDGWDFFNWRFDDVQNVAAGNGHIILLDKDGTALTQGKNGYGQLGDGTLTKRSSPTAVMTDIASVAAGHGTSLFVSSTGTVYAAGSMHWFPGAEKTSFLEPTAILTGIEKVKICGFDDGLIQHKDGTLSAVGKRIFQNSKPMLQIPNVEVPTTRFVSMACNLQKAQVVSEDGTLYEKRYAEAGWHRMMTGIRSTSLASNSAELILAINGSVYARGSNSNGQLGTGTTKSERYLRQVMTGVKSIAAGIDVSLFIKEDEETLYVAGGRLSYKTPRRYHAFTGVKHLAPQQSCCGGNADAWFFFTYNNT